MDHPVELGKFKGFSNFIPLGSWCRTAWQTNRMLEVVGRKKVSYPFDWTITPMNSVIKAIKGEISIDQVLNSNDTMVCQFGQVQCGHTGIRFAHDFKLKEMSGKYNFTFKNGELMPESFGSFSETRQARERFAYTYKNLCENLGKENTAFVRYIEVDSLVEKDFYKEVYSGEDPLRLLSCLKQHGAHPSSRLIYIFSKTVPGKKFSNCPVSRLKLSSKELFSCHIYERKGLNGNQADAFYGDSLSWLAVYRRRMVLVVLSARK